MITSACLHAHGGNFSIFQLAQSITWSWALQFIPRRILNILQTLLKDFDSRSWHFLSANFNLLVAVQEKSEVHQNQWESSTEFSRKRQSIEKLLRYFSPVQSAVLAHTAISGDSWSLDLCHCSQILSVNKTMGTYFFSWSAYIAQCVTWT